MIKCSNFVENYQEGQQRQPSTSWSEAELAFPVTDITANLYVLLQDKAGPKSDSELCRCGGWGL